MHRRSAPVLTTLALGMSLSLGACASEDAPGPTESGANLLPTSTTETPTGANSDTSPSETPSPEIGTPIEIERKARKFTPNGERVPATLGEPIILSITADEPGELHVHSTPEQQVSYGAGMSEHEITIDQPGVVEVESHEPALVVLRLELR